MNGTCDRCAAARRSDGEGAAENEDRASPGEPVAQGMGNHCPKIGAGGTSPASQPRSALSQAVKIDWWVTVAASTAS